MKHKKQIRAALVLFLLAFILPVIAAQKPSKKDAKANDDNETKQGGRGKY